MPYGRRRNLLPLVPLFSYGMYMHKLQRTLDLILTPGSFISPAVVSPSIVDVEVPKGDKMISRGLMVIAKIIQNLANNIFFGKEFHMVVLNTFLEENIVNVTRFLSEVNVSSQVSLTAPI